MPRKATQLSGYDVRDHLVFQFLKLVLDGELLLLHALDAQLIAAHFYHGIDGGVEIRMFLLQTSDSQSYICLFLIGHPVCPVLIICFFQDGLEREDRVRLPRGSP